MSIRTELVHAAEVYHEQATSAEAFYDKYRRETDLDSRKMGDVILGFLVEWGGSSTARAFPLGGRDKLRARLDEWYLSQRERIDELKSLNLWSVDLRGTAPDLADMFDGLRRLKQPRVGGKERLFGSTAAAKTLHLFLPNLCAIWDERWVRNKLGLDEQAWSYVSYERTLKALLTEVIADVSTSEALDGDDAVGWLVEEHARTVGAFKRVEPVTKILDEAVYYRAFRVGRVLPLAERIPALPWH